MQFGILGPLEVGGKRGAVAVAGAKPRAVLALLLLRANQPVSADRLAVALWGEDAAAGAVKTVQVYVSRLRKALGDAGVLATTPAGYRLTVGPDDLDAERFARQVAAGRRALEEGRADVAAETLREALALWRGPPLEEFGWAPFAPAEIERLEELRLVALELRVEAELTAGRDGALVPELQHLTHEHPWRERLHAQLMLALYRSGRQADALEAYHAARRALVEQLGIEPGPELHDLHQAILAHDPALDGSPAGAPVAARRDRLPAPPNRTIARGADVRTVVERLGRGSVRLLTLTGPGGVGKTRLAVEAARAAEPDFADGARFVSLAAVERAQDVPPAIVSALGVIPVAGESPEQSVHRFLGAKHLLLVVDNCEHLPGAAPFIGGLPAAGRTVTVLATSREPLAVQAEHLHPVAPLAVPTAGTPARAEAVADVDAVALFCERAAARDPGFALDDGNAAAVAEICRRVNGLPLAIELAAARCGLLSPAEIAGRLHAVLGAPGAAPRDAPARQRTLRATIEWSHALLAPDEKACFARFAVFAGGATVEAAEAITGATLATLDGLVAKSLLVRVRGTGAPTRLGMLETIREYAGEHFAVLPDRDAIRACHYRFFLALARRHGNDPALGSSARARHLAALDRDAENLQAALGWALEQDAGGPAVALAGALGEYWMARDRFGDCARAMDAALGKPGGDADPALRVGALLKKLWSVWPLGRGAEMPAIVDEAEAIARTLDDDLLVADVLACRAAACVGVAPDAASAAADAALLHARAAGDPWMLGRAAWARAVTGTGAGDLGERVEEAAALLEATGNEYRLADLFSMVGIRALSSGRDAEAAVYIERAGPLVRRIGQPYLWMLLRGYVGLSALIRGDPAAADEAFREQLALCRDLVILPAAGRAFTGLAAVAASRGDLERAASLAGAASSRRFPGERDERVEARVDAAFLEPARARLGAAVWDEAARGGAALSFDDAVAYALEESPGAASRPVVPAAATADDRAR